MSKLLYLTVTSALCLTACASPDISGDLKTIQTEIETIESKHSAGIKAAAEKSFNDTERAQLRSGSLIAFLSPECSPQGRNNVAKYEDCIVDSNAKELLLDADGTGFVGLNAYQVQKAQDGLFAYLDKLQAVASAASIADPSDEVTELGTNLTALAQEIKLQKVEGFLTDQTELLSQLAARGADSYRVHQLRKIVRETHSDVLVSCRIIANWYDAKASVPELLAKAEALDNGPTTYAELNELRAATKRLRDAYNNSPGRSFDRIALAHAKLAQTALRGPTLEEAQKTVDLFK